MRDPPAVGVNVTLTIQLWAGAKVPQLFAWLKSELFVPAILIPVIFRDAFPVFSMMMAAGLPLTPIACGGKFSRLGDGVKKGPFTPVPLSRIANGLIRVLSVRVMLPDNDPVVVGEKVTPKLSDSFDRWCTDAWRKTEKRLEWVSSPGSTR